jgi:hypothetical protein
LKDGEVEEREETDPKKKWREKKNGTINKDDV